MRKRIAVVGDIHGSVVALNALLRHLPGDLTLIFVGDYVNRGPDSRAVLSRLTELSRQRADAHFLRGNHDEAFLRCLESGYLTPFLAMGGAATIRSYTLTPGPDVMASLRSAVPPEHLTFLKDLDSCYRRDGLVVAHDAPTAEAHAEGASDVFLVFGHEVQADLMPTVTESRAAIDTGCGTIAGGRLCCFFWPDKKHLLVRDDGSLITAASD